MKTIGANDRLANGTKVRVGNRRGEVVGCETVQAANGGYVELHSAHLTERFKRGFGSTGKWEPIGLRVIEKPNYSFIAVV